MRVAVMVVFVSLLTTRSEASTSCMSKTEARQHFGTVYLYWHGPERCWDATPTHLHGVRHRVRHPEPTPHFVVPIPSPDLRRSANAMATDEPETELIIPWVERWTDITQRTPPASIVVTDRKSEPTVTSRDAVMVIIAIILTLAVVEFLFGGMRSVGHTHRLRLGARQ
jgi:hypothetical protein